MSRSVPREWSTYECLDPKKILLGLRRIETRYPLHELRPEAASLRTCPLRSFGEGRQAAIFCYGMGHVLGAKVWFAQVEREDYDMVAHFVVDDTAHSVPVQLKEWVPTDISAVNLQTEIDKLGKYVDSRDLVVAFYLNRNARVHIPQLRLPIGRIAELWFFGAKDPTQHAWHLFGNVLSADARSHEFTYPEI